MVSGAHYGVLKCINEFIIFLQKNKSTITPIHVFLDSSVHDILREDVYVILREICILFKISY